MDGTVLAPALEGMKHVKSEEGEMLTKPFLEVCKQILPVIDYRSRVKYYSFLNPLVMSGYIAEIHDAGLIGPLFKVYLEELPDESFIDVSADKCWKLVLQRLNQEIAKLANRALKPLHSVNGLEMFGWQLRRSIQSIDVWSTGAANANPNNRD